MKVPEARSQSPITRPVLRRSSLRPGRQTPRSKPKTPDTPPKPPRNRHRVTSQDTESSRQHRHPLHLIGSKAVWEGLTRGSYLQLFRKPARAKDKTRRRLQALPHHITQPKLARAHTRKQSAPSLKGKRPLITEPRHPVHSLSPPGHTKTGSTTPRSGVLDLKMRPVGPH